MSPKDLLSEKTRLPLSLVGTIIALVAAIVMWGKGLESRVEAHVREDEALGKEQALKIDATERLFYSIDSRLARIEGALGVKQR